MDGRDKRRGLHIAYALMLYYDAMGLAHAGSPAREGGFKVRGSRNYLNPRGRQIRWDSAAAACSFSLGSDP